MSIKMFSITFRENSVGGSLVVKAERQANTDLANLMGKFSLRTRRKCITYPEKFKSQLLGTVCTQASAI